MDALFEALAHSRFRARFALGAREQSELDRRGLAVMREHAARFVRERLAPAEPANDGSQTPMRNHPVFIAQHATATCCRACLHKWHDIAAHRALTQAEQAYVCDVILAWLAARHDPDRVELSRQGDLFTDE